MEKSYFLTYGAKDVSVDVLGERIAKHLNMKFEHRDSYYVGAYVKCIGPQADKLTIEPDKEGDGSPKYEEEPFCSYSVFVEASIIKGSNADREKRNSELKQAFELMPELVLLDETLLEN